MNRFSELYWQLDSTTKTNEKVAALSDYFASANPADAVWAIYFLTGNRIKRLVSTKLLRQWAVETSGVAAWLFEECYDRVGDLAETISLVLPPSESSETISLASLITDRLIPLREMDETEQRQQVVALWQTFDQRQLFVLGKLMTGGFRVGVSRRLVVRALAKLSGIDAAVITHRLMGSWDPNASFYEQLLDPDESAAQSSKPYPFFLANPVKEDVTSLGDAADWIFEWKWDGIRAQLVRRDGETFIWTRGEDLATDQFPEVAQAASALPDGTVLDGEILGWDWKQNRPLEFSQLQRRLGRKKLGKKLLQEVPVVMLAFDLIEHQGEDVRTMPIQQRQMQLERLLDEVGGADRWMQRPAAMQKEGSESERPDHDGLIRIPPPVLESTSEPTWNAFAAARESSKKMRTEGLMLKRKSSAYQVGRPMGDWWKWKVDPYTIDAVLIYAQRGHGRRASLYTDYTFALWKGDDLVPFAKAYSGLTDAEIRKVDAFVRKNTNEKFGPVRSVTPQLVFELAFENIQRSSRHKSGIAVRFPRINRWRHDKQPADADRLETILAMLETAS